MPTLLSDLLDEKHFLLDLRATAADEAVREIVAAMAAAGSVTESESFIHAVLARDRINSTILDHEVAFHHARTNLVEELALGFGRSAAGLNYGAGHRQVRLVFVVAVPQKRIQDYLVCIGALARLLRREEMREALLTVTDPAAIVERMREASLQLE